MESPNGQQATGKKLTPSAIANYLDQYVVGQDEAKKTLSVALYSHYRRLGKQRLGDVELVKSNILLIGPTGTGKTLLCETLSRIARVPFVTANATSLAQSKYVNEEIEALMQRLLDKAEGDIAKAQRGIVFIDEIDKLKSTGGEQSGTSGERVQHALLKIMEGAPVRLGPQTIDTTNILFICAGAFVGLDSIAAANHSFGFISVGDKNDQKILDRLNKRVKPTDLFKFGLIPEFAGRLPVIANLQNLSKELLVKNHGRAAQLDLQPVPRNPQGRGRRTGHRAGGLPADRRDGVRIQGGCAQPARESLRKCSCPCCIRFPTGRMRARSSSNRCSRNPACWRRRVVVPPIS